MMNVSEEIPTTTSGASRQKSASDKAMGYSTTADQRDPTRRETLRDPARVRSVFLALASGRCRGFIRDTDGGPVHLRIEGYNEAAGELICNFSETPDLPPNFLLEVEGYASMYWIAVTSSCGPLSARRCRVPRSVVRARHRHGLRGPAENLEVRFRHPTYGYPVQRRARDVSKRGLSFWLLPSDDIAMAGMRIEHLELVRNEEVVLSCSAEVRSVIPGTDGAACGVRVDPSSLTDLTAWTDLVDPVLHPSTVARADDTDALWRLFEDSGYMHLSGRTDGEFSHLKNTFESASKRLSEAPSIGCQVVYPAPKSNRLQATISLLKTQNHAWLGYQMAKLPGRVIDGVTRREMLRQVHLHAYEHASSDPSLRWLLGYVQDGTRFSHMVHQDFAARYEAEALSAVVRFRAMQTSTDIESEPFVGLEVYEGGPADVERLHSYAAKNFPSAYVDALDLHPDGFSIARLKEQWAAAGFDRERTLLVVRDKDEVLALAVVELGSEGIHLFGLLDCVRVYPISARASTGYGALIAACRQWYRERNREKFVLFREGEDLELLEGFEDLGFANQTIVSVSLLGDLLEHMFEVTAPSELG